MSKQQQQQPQITKSNIIELRQLSSNQSIQEGDYINNLSKPLLIKEGDQLNLKNCFIDNRSQQVGVINLPDDMNVQLQNLVYITYIDPAMDEFLVESFEQNGNVSNKPTGYSYSPYITSDTDNLPYSLYKLIDVKWISPNGGTRINIAYQYQNIAGQLVNVCSKLPDAQQSYTIETPYLDKNFGGGLILFREGTFKVLTDTNILNKAGWSWAGIDFSEADLSPKISEPMIFTSNLKIPKGSYSYLDLCIYISRKLSEINRTGPAENYDVGFLDYGFSPFLQTSFNFAQNGVPWGYDELTENLYFFDIFGGKGSLVFKEENNETGYWVGASQIALNYNSDNISQKVSWDYLSQPIYDNEGNISVKYYITEGDNPYNVASSSAGGIAWVSSVASYSKTPNQFFNFFEDILGFDNTIYLDIHGSTFLNNKFGFENQQVRQLNAEYGVNLTRGLFGLDSLLIKTNKDKQAQILPNPFIGGTGESYFSAVEDTVKIIAANSVNLLNNNYSHYLIELDFNTTNGDFITENSDYYSHSKIIRGICSKYYSYTGFYSSGIDDGFIYEHKGVPIYIKSIRTRILQPNKTLASDIGNDNTIYIEHLTTS